MFEFQGLRVMHWHGDDVWAPMAEGSEHTSVTHDPERAWMKGARIFRCTQCEEAVAIAPDEPGAAADPDHPHPGV